MTRSEKNVVENALKRGATRREAVQMMVAAGATAANSRCSFVTAATDAIAATPKKGGHVKAGMNLHGPDDTLDPIKLTSNADYGRARAHYNNLVQLSDDIVPQPELAESFEARMRMRLSGRLTLRKDVKFHDGSKFTADDVIWSLNRHLGKDSKSVAKGLVKTVKEWKKVGPYEVKAICETPYADSGSCTWRKALQDRQRRTRKTSRTQLVQGPFKLESFKPGIGSNARPQRRLLA